MEQVAGQQTQRRACVAWYKTSQSRFPSPPSFTRTGSLCRPCHNIKTPQTFSSRKLFQPPFPFFLFFSSDKLKCGWTLSEDFSCYWCAIWLQEEKKNWLFNQHHNLRWKLRGVFKEELATLANKGRQEGGAKRPQNQCCFFILFPIIIVAQFRKSCRWRKYLIF